MYPFVNECTHRQIVRVFMPERGLSWHLPLYLKGTGKSFLSLTSGCLEDTWKRTLASAMSGCGYGRQSWPVPRPQAWKWGFMNILIS